MVIKNMFDPKQFEDDPALILEFKKDLQSECQNFGDVKKVIVYDVSGICNDFVLT